ncbi:hypothetical protein [Polymorphospora rubra]|uniref:DUF4352 domain-containing protein n=1 Tax=Polymorphospora rubra TaxID=338584 RepID=A0A810MZB0_9ACTN|nr:hypothetical protein [Polymorphospora rubra]BCJ66467.1 hypothetical protein Prubr_34880 [Polymorphospora rubra]
MPGHRLLATALLMLVLPLAACGSGRPATGAADPTPGHILEIPVTVAPGTAWMGGETIALASGVTVATGEPVVVLPGAAGAGSTTAVRFAVTITNHRPEPLDVSAAVVRANIGTARVPATLVGGGDPGFRGVVEPGRQQTVVLTFSAPTGDLSVIEVSVAPAVRVGTALFQGSVD